MTPPSSGWRILEHTADTGLAIEAGDLPELFALAAEGLFEMIGLRGSGGSEKPVEVAVDGLDWPDLMYRWLRELLYLWTGEERVASEIRILSLSPYSIRARVRTAAADPAKPAPAMEIKAVTYHQLEVEKAGGRWRAQVIFDV